MELDIGKLGTIGDKIPLHTTTWDQDREEGDYVNDLKATHTEPLRDPIQEIPDDLKRNLAVTTMDALLNWGR